MPELVSYFARLNKIGQAKILISILWPGVRQYFPWLVNAGGGGLLF